MVDLHWESMYMQPQPVVKGHEGPMKTFKGARVCPLAEPAITYTSGSVPESDFF